jgi:hypothetical protein
VDLLKGCFELLTPPRTKSRTKTRTRPFDTAGSVDVPGPTQSTLLYGKKKIQFADDLAKIINNAGVRVKRDKAKVKDKIEHIENSSSPLAIFLKPRLEQD